MKIFKIVPTHYSSKQEFKLINDTKNLASSNTIDIWLNFRKCLSPTTKYKIIYIKNQIKAFLFTVK